MKARTFLAAATAAIFYRYPGATAQVVNDTVITYPGAGVQWNSTDQIDSHRAYRDVDKIPPGYLEGAILELQHESFATPMNLASNVNVTQCHKLIPVPAVNDSDTSASVVVNYPVGAVMSSSSADIASDTGVAITAGTASSTAPDASSATTPDTSSSASIVPSSSAVEESLQGVRRRHAMPNPYPYPDAASVTTVTSLTTVTTTVQASGADPSATSDASAALSSAEAALSSASLVMSSASAALASVSAGMSASSPTSDLAPSASTDTSDSEADPTEAASYNDSASATTTSASLDASETSSGTSSLPSGALDGQEDGTPAYAPSSTGTAAQTTSTSFVGAYFAPHEFARSALCMSCWGSSWSNLMQRIAAWVPIYVPTCPARGPRDSSGAKSGRPRTSDLRT